MEHNDLSGRQYAQPAYPASQQQSRGQPQPSNQFPTPTPTGRYRQQSYAQDASLAGSGTGRAGNEAQQQLYGFTSGMQYGASSSLSANPVQYGQDYQAQDSQRQQSQQFANYSSTVVYGLQQGQTPQTSPAAYDQGGRQSGTGDGLAAQFGESPGAHYYMGAQSSQNAAPTSDFAGSAMASQFQSPATYAQPAAAAPNAFPSSMIDPGPPSTYNAYAQQTEFTPQRDSHGDQADQAYAQYHRTISSIFSQVRDDALRDVPQQLLEASQYLLGNVEALGLTRDEEGQHDHRLGIWDEFNRAWLTTLQRQFDLTQSVLSGVSLHDSQSIINQHWLERLGRDIVRFSDGLEKHGLVDYQMGVFEEEIIDLILRCLSLLDTTGRGTSESGEASTAGAERQR